MFQSEFKLSCCQPSDSEEEKDQRKMKAKSQIKIQVSIKILIELLPSAANCTRLATWAAAQAAKPTTAAAYFQDSEYSEYLECLGYSYAF